MTSIIFDAAPQQIAMVDANSHRRTSLYASRGSLHSTQDALGAFIKWSYDPVANTVLRTDARNFVTSYTQDALNRAVGTLYPDSTRATHTFDAVRQQITQQDSTGIRRFSWDLDGRQIGMVDPAGMTLTYTLDPVGNRLLMQDPNAGLTSYSWVLHRTDWSESSILSANRRQFLMTERVGAIMARSASFWGVLSNVILIVILLVGRCVTISKGQAMYPLHKTVEPVRFNASRGLLKEVKSDHENLNRISALLAKGANVNERDVVAGVKWYTPLQYAAQKGYWKTVELLVKQRANVNPKASFGDEHFRTPLMECVSTGPHQVVRFLIAHGADVNARGYNDLTALMLAASAGRTDNIKILLHHGADPYAQSYLDNKTALDFAKQAGHLDVVRLLSKFHLK